MREKEVMTIKAFAMLSLLDAQKKKEERLPLESKEWYTEQARINRITK